MAESTKSVRCANCDLLFLQPAAPRQTRTARVVELLLDNHPPLDVEIAGFRSDRDSARAALQDLDEKIAQAKELLDILLSAREEAQSNLDDAESLLHPMRSIPSELLLEIFSHCVPTVESPLDTDSLHPLRAPWLMTLVCHRWRELVMSSPRLWTQLLIDIDYPAGGGVDLMYADRASRFIERSRGLPMGIYLASTHLVSNHWFTVLGNSISRCTFLHVDIPRSSLQCLFEKVFSHLRTLVVMSDHLEHPDSNLGAHQRLRAPALRELDVLSRESWGNLEAAALPWSQLTSVGNFPAFDVEAWRYLRMMTNLENLSVHVEDSEFYTQISDSVIPLPKLCRLTMIQLCRNATRCSKQFFAALQISALVDLTLKFPDRGFTVFPTMSSTSPLRNLTRLDISCNMNAYEENTQYLLDFLSLTPRVEHLRIHDRTMTAEFVDGLNISNESPVRLPSLVFLDIGDCRYDRASTCDLGPIVDMLYSRLPRNATEGETDAPVYQQTTRVVAVSPREDCTHLKTVHLPRPFYVSMRDHWPDTFLEISRKIRLVCGVA